MTQEAAVPDKRRAEERYDGQFLPAAGAGRDGWTSCGNFTAVLETTVPSESDLAEYCRQRVLYPAQLKARRAACKPVNDRRATLPAGRDQKQPA